MCSFGTRTHTQTPTNGFGRIQRIIENKLQIVLVLSFGVANTKKKNRKNEKKLRKIVEKRYNWYEKYGKRIWIGIQAQTTEQGRKMKTNFSQQSIS